MCPQKRAMCWDSKFKPTLNAPARSCKILCDSTACGERKPQSSPLPRRTVHRIGLFAGRKVQLLPTLGPWDASSLPATHQNEADLLESRSARFV